MNELKDVVVFGYDNSDNLIILDYGKYTIGSFARKMMNASETNYDVFIKDGDLYYCDEVMITHKEAQQQYGEISWYFTDLYGNGTNIELIPVSRLTDVGNEKYLQVAKEVAKKFPIYKAVTEMVHLLYND